MFSIFVSPTFPNGKCTEARVCVYVYVDVDVCVCVCLCVYVCVQVCGNTLVKVCVFLQPARRPLTKDMHDAEACRARVCCEHRHMLLCACVHVFAYCVVCVAVSFACS